MAVYEKRADLNSNHLTQTEVHLYGSSRLGILTTNRDVETAGSPGNGIFERGNKFFELSNHLGNMLATVSDRRVQVSAGGINVDYYLADVVSASDNYPFGMQMPGRKYSTDKYRYSINGQEKSPEIAPNTTTALYWEYDSRTTRRWNLDPVPQVYISDYAVNGLNPLIYIDPLGDNKYKVHSNGKIQKVKTKDKFDQFFVLKDGDGDGDKEWVQIAKFEKNEKDLIKLTDKFRYEGWGWNYTGSAGENFVSGEAMAGILGALRNSNVIVSFNHWSNEKGESPAPSVSHKNGVVGDIRPLRTDKSGGPVLVSDAKFDKNGNTELIKNLKLFGWSSILSEKYNGWITPGTTHYSGYRDKYGIWHSVRHHNHYHIQRFKPQIEVIADFTVEPVESPEPKFKILQLERTTPKGFNLGSGIKYRGSYIFKNPRQ